MSAHRVTITVELLTQWTNGRVETDAPLDGHDLNGVVDLLLMHLAGWKFDGQLYRAAARVIEWKVEMA